MARLVEEIMNGELFTVSAKDSAQAVISYLLALEISGAPVVDGKGVAIGMVSLRDLVVDPDGERVGDLMNTPPLAIRSTSTVDEAARILAETGYHRLVAVNEAGVAIGNVSSVDVIRALLGMPARHPEPFPHYDRETGLTWSDDAPLALDHVEKAPDGPGVLVLVAGGAEVPERMVWAESSNNLRTRVVDLLSLPQDAPELSRLLRWENLRFRAAQLSDPEAQAEVLSTLMKRSQSLLRFMRGGGAAPS